MEEEEPLKKSGFKGKWGKRNLPTMLRVNWTTRPQQSTQQSVYRQEDQLFFSLQCGVTKEVMNKITI